MAGLVWFTVALPKTTIPPQSPRSLDSTVWEDVNTMGCEAVPSAISLLPGYTIKVPLVALSPKITEPGSMVTVLPSFMNTCPLIK